MYQGKRYKKVARKKCSKCGSTKIIKRGRKTVNNAFNARFAKDGFQTSLVNG